MFASVVWFRTKGEAETYDQYKGTYVAILGEQIIDADRDKGALVRRLEAMGDALPPNRVVIQYIPRPDEVYGRVGIGLPPGASVCENGHVAGRELMSEPNQPTTPNSEYPEWTKEDSEAIFASVVWFRDQQYSGALAKYEGMHVAFVGEQIIDADRDQEALSRRLDAMGDVLPRNRLAVLYVPTAEEAWRY